MLTTIASMVAVLLAAQPVVLDETDRSVYRAAYEAVVRPERQRRLASARDSAPPLLVVDQTLTACTTPPTHSSSMGCLDSELTVVEGRHPRQTSVPFAGAISEGTRAILVNAFRERNQASTTVPHTLLDGAATTTPEAKVAAAREGRRLSAVTFSAPAYSEDGYAIVFTSYTCGSLCGYGWFVLLREVDDQWRVVDTHLAWIS